MTPSSGRPYSNILPPWLWFWLATFLLSLPNYAHRWQASFSQMFQTGPFALNDAMGSVYLMSGLVAVLEELPSIALFIGIVSLLAPKIRAKRLEQRYKLVSPSNPTPAVSEIIEFIEHHAPGIQVKLNLLGFDQHAFVYPLGFGQSGIAIFGLIVKLWRSDRPSAEVILVHELAHYRHGDAFIVGAGSLFRTVVERWGFLYLILFVIPFAAAFLTLVVTFFLELGQLNQLGISWFTMLPRAVIHTLGNSIMLAFGAIGITLALLFWTATAFVLPMSGIWCSEFNADQAAARRSEGDTLRALGTLPDQVHWRQWLLFRIAHPPNRLREWLVSHTQEGSTLTGLLLLYPLSYLVRLALLGIWSVLGGAGSQLGINLAHGLRTIAPLWLVMAVLLGVWPFVAPHWERLFCKTQQTYTTLPKRPYWVSSGIVLALSLWGYSQG